MTYSDQEKDELLKFISAKQKERVPVPKACALASKELPAFKGKKPGTIKATYYYWLAFRNNKSYIKQKPREEDSVASASRTSEGQRPERGNRSRQGVTTPPISSGDPAGLFRSMQEQMQRSETNSKQQDPRVGLGREMISLMAKIWDDLKG